MLETPLFGRFHGEGRRLIFSAPTVYHTLIRICIFGGIGAVLIGRFGQAFGFEIPLSQGWWEMVGILVALAGGLAAFSLHSISFDLREHRYRRRQGPGMFPAQTIGSIKDLDALVLISEPNGRMMTGGVTYHLVLHWKGQREAPMVVQQDSRMMLPGQPLNYGAQFLLSRGMEYARALELPFYDNSHYASPNPVPLIR